MIKAFFIFILVVVIGTVLVLVVAASRASKKMKQKALDSGAISVLTASHIEGLGITPKAPCDIYLFENKILIDSKGQKFDIELSQIRAAVYKDEQEIIEKSKGVVGRAVIGTLLLPGLGTIVGGMTGIGSKKVKGERNFYLILNYVNKSGELQGATFLNNLNIVELGRFCDKINTMLSNDNREVISL